MDKVQKHNSFITGYRLTQSGVLVNRCAYRLHAKCLRTCYLPFDVWVSTAYLCAVIVLLQGAI